MDDDSYRYELRNHFMGQMKNSKIQSTAQHFKEHAPRAQQKMQEFEPALPKQRQPQPRSSGGDADRVLYDPIFVSQNSGDTFRRNNEANYIRQLHYNPRAPVPVPVPALHAHPASAHKYHSDEAGDRSFYETDSNLGGDCGGSEESAKSQKSSKTVVSKKSSQDLRKMVKSQCKLHEVIDETLKQMCSAEGQNTSHDPGHPLKEHSLLQIQPCKSCSNKVRGRQSQKDVTTEIGKGDFLECRSGDTLTISVDDVVNSKVINPMIRKLQRMYLNNLKEEMSLMEDLERLPHKVNEVYKATIFKQKD